MACAESYRLGKHPVCGQGCCWRCCACCLALPGSAAAQGLDTTCQFSLTRLDATTTNVLAVDTNAVYWGGTYAALPGTRIRIEGQYPHSRYISWNVYDAAARPIDALSDVQLAPGPGQHEPVPARRVAHGGAARLHRVHRGRPAPGAARAEHALHRRLAGGTFLYRVYVPDAGRDAKGGVPLPTRHARVGRRRRRAARRGAVPRAPGALRPAAQRPDRGRARAGRTRRRTARATRAATRRTGGCSRTSAARRWTSCSTTSTGEPFHPGARDRCGNGPGFFSNRDIAYVFAPHLARVRRAARAARARADVRRHAPGPGRDAERAAAPLLVLLPVRARDPARDRLPLGRSRERRPRRPLHDRRLDAGAAPRQRAAGVRGHVAALGPADAGSADLPAHASRPVVRAGDPERAASPAPSATRWATTTRAASTSPIRATSRRGVAGAAESDLLDCRR